MENNIKIELIEIGYNGVDWLRIENSSLVFSSGSKKAGNPLTV
jgi:hypothetical protein